MIKHLLLTGRELCSVAAVKVNHSLAAKLDIR